MADYPCDFHGARYSGPSNRLYLNLYREEQQIKLKASVCGLCLETLVSDWLQHGLHQVQGGGWDPPTEAPELECLWMATEQASSPRNGYGRH